MVHVFHGMIKVVVFMLKSQFFLVTLPGVIVELLP